jgi:16S rRNA (cytosine1407-C5)-methyltransferase
MSKSRKDSQRGHNKFESSDHQVQTLLATLEPLLSPQEYQALLAELDQPLPAALRLNPLKLSQSPDTFIEQLSQHYDWVLSPLSYCETGWRVESGSQPPGQTWEHRLGRYYVQDASSMLPVELFDLSHTEQPLILDMAASPGGKTTHLISKTNDKGLVIANDASHDRITALRVVLQNWGSINHAITQFQGERFGQWFPNTFDAVLLDAPCSMQNLRSTEARPMRDISAKEEHNLAKRQQKLLESALFSLKPGGQLVYATCTLTPQEDEFVLDWLLSHYPRSVHIDDLSTRMGIQAPALSEAYGSPFHPTVQNAFRLWPHRLHSSGFFCASLTKLDGIHGKVRPAPTFDIQQTDFEPLSTEDSEHLLNLMIDQWQLDFAQKYMSEDRSLWRKGKQIFLFPDRFFTDLNALPLRSLGMLLGDFVNSQFTPDFFFMCRLFYENELPSTIIEEDLAELWMSGQSIPCHPIDDDNSPIVIMKSKRGEFLGAARPGNGQFKNNLPRRVII